MSPARPKVLLVTPPMMQLNAAYPAVPMLTGFLRAHGYSVAQADASFELALRLFSRAGLTAIRDELDSPQCSRFSGRASVLTSGSSRRSLERPFHPAVRLFLRQFSRYADTVDGTIRFMQGREPELASRIVTRRFLPEGPRYRVLQDWDRALPALSEAEGAPGAPPADSTMLAWRFGDLGIGDRAKYLASLYIDDLADVVRWGVDERFELSRYAEKLAVSLPSFEPLRAELDKRPTLIDRMTDSLAAELLKTHHPHLVGFTVPFPGNLYAALRMARRMKRLAPRIQIVLGGGYVNTELRGLEDPGIFDIVDFVTLDDGEAPLLRLLEHIGKRSSADRLVRTFTRRNGRVVFHDAGKPGGLAGRIQYPASGIQYPTFDGLQIDRRIGMMELPNPVYRLWSDGRWNKLMLAHGCYWHRCAFCDTSLDYIRGFRPEPARVLVDRIEAVIAETGQTGFHFVDEAAPPALLRLVADEILRRRLTITWWGNIRFEKPFTPALVRRLADSGCIALTGGLETVCNRTLTLMNKGITVEQAVRIAGVLAAHGILVHAYLMYGFPSQTAQETVDALETVRQIFEQGCLQSAYWHRFALTVHSPMAQTPDAFGIRLLPMAPAPFARNEIPFEDLGGCDPEPLAPGLRKAVYNYLHGIGFDHDVQSWFDTPVPCPRIPRRFVARILGKSESGHGA